jgi:Protein of unknown function (DUF3185)
MKLIQILGVVAFAVGAVLLVFAYHASNAPLDQITNTLTGRYSDRTMWYTVLGAAAIIGGSLLALFGKRI